MGPYIFSGISIHCRCTRWICKHPAKTPIHRLRWAKRIRGTFKNYASAFPRSAWEIPSLLVCYVSILKTLFTLKTVAIYRDLPFAELAKSNLESEEIYCFLANKNHIDMNWLYSFALGGVKVQVRKEDFKLAQRILDEDHSFPSLRLKMIFLH